MSRSPYPSSVVLPDPDKPYPTILAFLVERFPGVSRERWEERIRQGKVIDEEGVALTVDSAYRARKKIHYFREVAHEPYIPFREAIVFQNDDILVACKPHFLPVNPAGRFVNECLLNRLRKRTGNENLTPLHRIDRHTAGLVMFSGNPKTRSCYSERFRGGHIQKTYLAISQHAPPNDEKAWTVENRITAGDPWFRMQVVGGPVNARSTIRLISRESQQSKYVLMPHTGKKHQLRLHMAGLGFPIMNDNFYPVLQPEGPDNFDKPLRLIAKSLKFEDPVSGKIFEFQSERDFD